MAVAVDEIDKIVQHYSSWYRLKRAIAWLLRFKDFLGGCRKFDRHLTVEELGHSEVSILRYVQGKSYHKERALLSSGKLLNNDSSVKALNPVIGSDGLLRVGSLREMLLLGTWCSLKMRILLETFGPWV